MYIKECLMLSFYNIIEHLYTSCYTDNHRIQSDVIQTPTTPPRILYIPNNYI